MKINFKRIAPVLASAVLLGSTIGFAAASADLTAYPSSFAGATVIYGGDAKVDDVIVGADFAADIASRYGATGTASGVVSATGGDNLLLSKSSDKINLGNGLGDVWGSSITSSDLKTVLADGKFFNKQNTEYKYTQKLDLGNLNFTDISDSELNSRVPTLGFSVPANAFVANYTLSFVNAAESTNAVDLTDFENKDITILGKNYYILDFKNNTAKITLLDSATSTVLNEAENASVSVGDKVYDVKVSFISTDQVILNVNGENTDKMSATGTTYGNTYKLSDGTYIGVKNINVQDYAGGSKSVEFSIGKGKLELSDSSNVKINDKNIDDLTAYITLAASSSKQTWTKLVLQWKPQNKAFLVPGKELVMPGFEAVKFTMGDTTIPAKENTVVSYDSSDAISLKTTIKDGEWTIPLAYISTSTGNFTAIGKSDTQRLATATGLVLNYNATSGTPQNEGFIVSWNNTRDSETYYLKASARYSSNDGKNYTTITNKVTGNTLCEDLSVGGTSTCNIGSNIVLTINQVNVTSGADKVVKMTVNSGGSFNKIYTKEGLAITLPTGDLSLYNNSYTLAMSEEDKDGNLGMKAFSISLGSSGTSSYKTTVGNTPVTGALTAYETATSSKMWESYVNSDLATKIVVDKTSSDQYSTTIEYHGGQVYANAYIAAAGTTVTSSATGGAKANVVNMLDTDAETAKPMTNLIVVGGPAVNKVTAKLLGISYPTYGSQLTGDNAIAADSALMKLVASSYDATKVAIVVFGWEAKDTTAAGKYLIANAGSTGLAKQSVLLKTATGTAVVA